MPGVKRTGINGAIILEYNYLYMRYGIRTNPSPTSLFVTALTTRRNSEATESSFVPPNSLEVLFEHAYTRKYEETTEGKDILNGSEEQLSQHLHIFFMADKYRAESLEAYAFKNL
ncbi:hypothetical protein CFE70_000532 [Pyrenophora teres f. teres 0-1]